MAGKSGESSHAELSGLAARFERFGKIETPGSSPLYARLALAVAGDDELLALAAHCGPGQPPANLFLGAVHYLLLDGRAEGKELARYYPSLVPDGHLIEDDAGLESAFRRFCLEHAAEITWLIETRLVQTNEVARCGDLLPAFGRAAVELRAPLFLIEIGPSAGLNLLWDRYGYTYVDGLAATVAWAGDPRSPVQLTTNLRGGSRPPVPATMPAIGGRLGIDLHPVDVRDSDAIAWLRALIWPEHADRLDRLRLAVAAARENPPPLLEGDAFDLLPRALAAIPDGQAPIIFHTFTLNQFTEEARAEFRALLLHASRSRDVVEIGIEMVKDEAYALLSFGHYRAGRVDVTRLAHCDGHGRWLEWLEAE